jgi:uncharacterized BrkB/YihY/UPF0761 family membrane protein
MTLSMTTMKAFAQKFAHDWSMNLVAILAYHLILTAFPILLAVLSVAGMLLHAYRATNLKHDLAATLNHLLPRALQSAIDVSHLLFPFVFTLLQASDFRYGAVAATALV